MPQRDNQTILLALVGGMALIVIAMIVSIFIATRRPVVVVVPGGGIAETIAAPGELLPPPVSGDRESAPPALPVVSVRRVAQTPALDDPFDAFWDQVAAVDLELSPQQVAPPTLAAGTISQLRVQGVRDDRRIVWRLTWAEPQPAAASDGNVFTDAVAMQFPLVDGAPYTMGGPGMPVTMLYWKAIWQKDVDEGFQDTTVTHPEAFNDLYWFAKDAGPQPADRAFDDPAGKQWFIAAAAGNPMAQFHRATPLEEIKAEGFGSATHAADSPSNARGRWRDGQWAVVIDRQLDAADPLIARFNANLQQQLVAFAVFDGSADNRGAQKHITNWIPMRIDP